MILGKPTSQVLCERISLIRRLYDECDKTYDALDALLSKRILSPEPGLEPLISKATADRDAAIKHLDREIQDLGYIVFTGCNLGAIQITDISLNCTGAIMTKDPCCPDTEFYLLDE